MLEQALYAMIDKGLVVPDFSEALALLHRLNTAAESARSAVAEFVEISGCDKSFLEIGVKEIYENIPSDLPIFPIEGALELLSEIKEQYQLALVTIGNKRMQMDKM